MNRARRSGKPAIVFIDEIDALGGKRGEDTGGGAIQDSNKTLNQFLVELDGFGKHKVLTIGATNNPDILDPALLRPGRFDRIIEIPLPNLEGRIEILKKYLGKYKLHEDVNLTEIARMTVFDSGADLANVANEAGLFAIREGRTVIQSEDIFRAIQRVSFGISRSQRILVEELWSTAYHEAGHTIVSYLRNKREYVQVVTIVPTGRALGYMWRIKKDDPFHHSPTKQELMTRIEIALGGYAAEMAYMETTTAGVSSDLQHVSQVASAMVREYGMGSYSLNTNWAFGNSGSAEETRALIDKDIQRIVNECLETTRNLIKSKRAELDLIAKALVEKETLYYRDLVAILEPQRSKEDIDQEISEMSERKLVGKPAVINLDLIPGLKGIAAGSKKKSARDTNGNGKNGHGAEKDAGGTETKEVKVKSDEDKKADDKKDEESKN
jgi:cell division protease FtsH